MNEQPRLRIYFFFLKRKNLVKLTQKKKKKLFDWKIETAYKWVFFKVVLKKSSKSHNQLQFLREKLFMEKEKKQKNNERRHAAKQKTCT